MSCRSQISHTPITVQYWRIMNKSIFYIEDFLFHNVHLSLFYPLSGTWWLTPQLLLSNCPFLISRYMMSLSIFFPSSHSVSHPSSLPPSTLTGYNPHILSEHITSATFGWADALLQGLVWGLRVERGPSPAIYIELRVPLCHHFAFR